MLEKGEEPVVHRGRVVLEGLLLDSQLSLETEELSLQLLLERHVLLL